jgi:hypothetical protein
MGDKVKLYNVNDGLTGRTGGPYLDQEQANQAEIRRAEIEGREPDLNGMQPYAGSVLVPAARLLDTATVNNLPSEDGKFNLAEAVDVSKGIQHVAEVELDGDSDESTSGSVSDESSSGRRANRSS